MDEDLGLAASAGGEGFAGWREHQAGSRSVDSMSVSDGSTKSGHESTIRLCIVGATLGGCAALREATLALGLEAVYSEAAEIEDNDRDIQMCYVVEKLDSRLSQTLCEKGVKVYSARVVMEAAERGLSLQRYERPLYSLAMANLWICCSGLNRATVQRLLDLVHHMGGSIHKNFSQRVTHLVAASCTGPKYEMAVAFGVPVMRAEWVEAVWARRDERGLVASDTQFSEYRLKPFFEKRVHFIGFTDEETSHMKSILAENGGIFVPANDTSCTHVVLDDEETCELYQANLLQILPPIPELPEKVVDDQNITSLEMMPLRAQVVKAEWFWATVQMVACVNEDLYLFEKPAEFTSPRHAQTLPSQASRKRKRLKDAVAALAQEDNNAATSPSAAGPALKRRSSVSDATMLSVSGSFLDGTLTSEKTIEDDDVFLSPPSPIKLDLRDQTPRQRVFNELWQTESNYVKVLTTIMKLFKEPLDSAEQVGGPVLDPTELKIIFGNLPPIHEAHTAMLQELSNASRHWHDDNSVGNIVLKHSGDLLKAYPPFVNFFENTKEMLVKCDAAKPRFHAFLKIAQSKPECGRQTLQELLIRPVQRLPSISLLLGDILKHTSRGNPDHAALEKALARIKDVMTHINEDKRKTEGQLQLFDIFNEIENCPPHLVSSHRSFVSRCEVIQRSDDGLCGRGDQLILFLFTDVVEICKKRSKSYKSPSVVNLQAAKVTGKPYKHVEMLHLSNIRKVVDIRETSNCHNVFALMCRNNQDVNERLYTFTLLGEDVKKANFLRTLCRQMANSVCRADSENLLYFLDPAQLDIDTSEVSVGALTRAVRFASKTRQMVGTLGRALSFNKTPGKLKRAVSQMMSPFGERGASGELQNLRMGSCQSLANMDLPETSGTMPRPASTPQPPRKTKTSMYGYSVIKRA